MLSSNIINRLVAAKHQLRIAEQNSQSSFSASQYAAINNLQDSVELFLLSVAEAVGSGTSEQTFANYFVTINAEAKKFIENERYELPFKGELLRLNRTRVASKHHGVLPDRKEVEKFIIIVRAFYEEVCRSLLDIEFASVSLVDLVTDEKLLPYLMSAISAFEAGNYYDCLVECRKAVYMEFEREYDIQQFKDGSPATGLLGLSTKAPYYACRKEYIEENVENSFDYIVIDTSRLDLELMKAGIPPETFWNIRRMTPDVYYDQGGGYEEGKWKVEINFGISDEESLRSRSEYVLDETVKTLVKMEEHKRSLRPTSRHDRYRISVKAGTKVYKKASDDSEVLRTIPDWLSEVLTTARIPSLLGNAEFYAIRHYSAEHSYYCYGYIAVSDVD